MATLNQRITELEQKTVKLIPEAFRIICKGATPTSEEQAQIDEADKRGDFVFVIVRTIITPLQCT